MRGQLIVRKQADRWRTVDTFVRERTDQRRKHIVRKQIDYKSIACY
jgi:hypothetical protein